jgi:hypothetical protein
MYLLIERDVIVESTCFFVLRRCQVRDEDTFLVEQYVLYDTIVPRRFYRVVCRVVFFRHTITV